MTPSDTPTTQTPQVAEFLITGGVQVGKSAFIHSVVMGEGDVLEINDALKIRVHEMPLAQVNDRPPKAVGAVLLVDGRHADSFGDVLPSVAALRQDSPLALIVAVNFQDDPAAAGSVPQLRQLLPEHFPHKIFPCVATETRSAQNVLLALIYQMLSGEDG